LINPGWRRCLALVGLDGMAKRIFGDLGEGRTIEPTTEELLFVRPRTSWSVESSKTNKGRMWYKSVHLLEGREERSVK
jgi:hypothetical protein